MLISHGQTGDQWSAQRHQDGVLVEGQTSVLGGVVGVDRRGQSRPVEVKRRSPQRLQAAARKRRRDALSNSPFRAVNAKPGPNVPDQATLSESQTTPGTSTAYMRGIRHARQVDETWYRQNDLSKPKTDRKGKVIEGDDLPRGRRVRSKPQAVETARLVYQSETGK